METKICKCCGKELPIDEFYVIRNRRGYEQRHSWCKACIKVDTKKRYWRNKGTEKEYHYKKKVKSETMRVNSNYYAVLVNPDTKLYEVKKFVWEDDELDKKLLKQGKAFGLKADADARAVMLNNI